MSYAYTNTYTGEQAVKLDERYRGPYLEGYKWIGNSTKEAQEEAIADYRASEPDSELIANSFNPEGIAPDDPLWQYTTKWAIYKKV